jgi:hypothetical protein
MDGLKSECLGGFRLEEVDGFVGIRTMPQAWPNLLNEGRLWEL